MMVIKSFQYHILKVKIEVIYGNQKNILSDHKVLETL